MSTDAIQVPWQNIMELLSPLVEGATSNSTGLTITHSQEETIPRTTVSVSQASAPIGIGGELVGVLHVETELPGFETPRARQMTMTMNNMAALGCATTDRAGKRVKLRSRLSMYKEDRESWRIFAPLVALSAATNIQVAGSTLSEALHQPQTWPCWPDRISAWRTDDFVPVAERLNAMKCYSNAGSGLTAEFPWEEGAISASVALLGTSPHLTSLLTMATDEAHPLLGAGLLCTLQLPVVMMEHDAPDIIDELNEREATEIDAPPSFGAWCLVPGAQRPAYVCFLPNILHGLRIEHNLAVWMGVRSRLAREWLHQ